MKAAAGASVLKPAILPARPESHRLPAIDVVRGIVMILMTLDHASSSFNAGRLMQDSAATYRPGTVLDPLQFLVRWVTHLCAPTFLFLAGVSLALSVARRQRAGASSAVIDRDILVRGGLLVALEFVWMSWVMRLAMPLQIGVLYAIGASMLVMVALRRLPPAVIGALGVALFVGGEAVIGLLDPGMPVVTATLAPGPIGPFFFLYPFLPWTGFMMLGWAAGMRLAGRGMRSRDWLVLAAIAAAIFAVVRGLDGYGNAHLHRGGGSWVDWLHVSKYPPSLAYASLELAIAFAALGLAWRWKRPWKPVVVLGQTALFYYLLHIHLFKAVALPAGLYKSQGLAATVVAWAAMLVVLYPACRWYLEVKRRHPQSFLRYI